MGSSNGVVVWGESTEIEVVIIVGVVTDGSHHVVVSILLTMSFHFLI